MKAETVKKLNSQMKEIQPFIFNKGYGLNFNNKGSFMIFKCLSLLACLTALPLYAAGGESGGGGDASEERVDEIRSDILSWIDNGGARGLILPSHLSYEDYTNRMTEVLQPKNVVIGFVEKDDDYNVELMVNVNGVPKTCRGFTSVIDSKFHILCNISRFKKTSESEQYKLIHHEYAGLVNVEENEDAASDYEISSQLTDYLSEQKTLKLAIKKNSLNDSRPSTLKCANVEAKRLNILQGGGWKYSHKFFELKYDSQNEVYEGQIADDDNYITELARVTIDLKSESILMSASKERGYINSSHHIPSSGEKISVSGKFNKTDYFGIECMNTTEEYKPQLFNF